MSKKHVGRPTDNPKTHRITIRLDDHCYDIINDCKQKTNVTMGACVRRAIKQLGNDPEENICKLSENDPVEPVDQKLKPENLVQVSVAPEIHQSHLLFNIKSNHYFFTTYEVALCNHEGFKDECTKILLNNYEKILESGSNTMAALIIEIFANEMQLTLTHIPVDLSINLG